MVVVFDTDVVIPMILPASRSARLFLRLTAAGHTVALSPAILEEVREKLLTDEDVRDWLALTNKDIKMFLERLPAVCMVTPGVVTIQGVVRDDPDDDMIVAAAVESGASYVISEDRHLRKLKEWQGIKIMSRNEFGTELDRLGAP